jgi:hypothetical protein
MIIQLALTRDSHNTYAENQYLTIQSSEYNETVNIQITGYDREIAVSKKALIKALEAVS